MLKRFISAALCVMMALTAVPAYMDSTGYSYSAEAAADIDTPYYYSQLTDEAKLIYNELKKAVPECKRKVRVKTSLDQNDFDMLCEFVISHDTMMFNVEEMSATLISRNTVDVYVKYKYSKETYEKMVDSLNEKADKILEKLTDDMSTYTKIRTIHDEIIKTTSYDLESKTNDMVYGTLVQKKAKCDGYAKAFNYICGKAGIRVVNVRGTAEDEYGMLEPHMWNKVYYNKKWYNVDVTWDDLDDPRHMKFYNYFMISDEEISDDHAEGSRYKGNYNFKNPAANDDSIDYYKVNKKYIEDASDAESVIESGIKKAVKNKTKFYEFKCAPSEMKKVIAYLDDPNNVCGILGRVKKSTGKKIVTDFYTYSYYEGTNIFCIPVFYEGADLEDYFGPDEEIGQEWIDMLAEHNID